MGEAVDRSNMIIILDFNIIKRVERVHHCNHTSNANALAAIPPRMPQSTEVLILIVFKLTYSAFTVMNKDYVVYGLRCFLNSILQIGRAHV